MNNKFQKLFITVWNTPNRYKYFLYGGVFQLAFILFLFIPVIGWIRSALIFVYMCGYYLVSIRHNIDNDDFVRVDWREKGIFYRGIRVLGAFILFLAVLYCVIMLFALIIFLLFFLFALIIGIYLLKEIPAISAVFAILLIIAGTFFITGGSGCINKTALIYRIMALIFSAAEAVFIKKIKHTFSFICPVRRLMIC